MPPRKSTEKPAEQPKKPEPAASTVTHATEGGDPLPERGEQAHRPEEGEVAELATLLAQSQGYRRPSAHNLRASHPVSFESLAEMIIIGVRHVGR